MGLLDPIKNAKTKGSARWVKLKRDRPGVAHVVNGYAHYQRNHGDHLAAAITYFSFLALFPLILLAVSILGFVLAHDQHLLNELLSHVSSSVPGAFGDTIKTTIATAIKDRTGVGIVGVVGFLLAGLGWIDNLRTAIDTVWDAPARKLSFIAKKISDTVVLVGLGVGVVISLALTAGGTAVGGELLKLINLDTVPGMGTVTALLGIVLGIAGSTLVFGWIMIRIPDISVSSRTALRASVLAAVGFEVLKLIGTFYIARVTKSPAGSVIGPIVGILVWIDLVSRYLLFCVAWAATAEPAVVAEAPVEGPSVGTLVDTPPPINPVGIAAGLVTAGAAVGAGSLALVQRRRRRPTATKPPPR
jgi:membrane protein